MMPYISSYRRGVAHVVLFTVLSLTCMVTVLGAAFGADGFQNSQRKDFINGAYWCAMGPAGRSFACFESRGDWLQVGDLKTDKRRVGVRWSTSRGRKGVCVHKSGHWAEKRTFSSVVGYRACNKRFAIGVTVRIRSGHCYAAKNNCNRLKNWHWGPVKRFLNDS